MYTHTIETVTESDIPEIINIEKECYSIPWNLDHFKNEIILDCAINYKIKISNRIIGYSFSHYIENELQINNFCIEQQFQNQGYGSLLMKYLLDMITSKGAQSVFLEVRQSNNAAIQLYSKFNFVKSYVRKNFYSDGENAVVMYLKC